MSDVFYESPLHGTLLIDSVYEFYDEPRLFSVSNEVGSVFIVYWASTDDDSDTWFLIPISQLKLKQFEMKQVCIRDMLLYQEKKNFFKLEMPFDPDAEIKAEFILSNTIQDVIELPKHGVYISNSPEDEQFESPVVVRATHEIHIQKKAKKAKKLALESISKIFESFSYLYNSISNSFDSNNSIEGVGARPGSFILSFNVEHCDVIDSTLSQLFSLIEAKEDIQSYIESNNIDASALSDLLSQIVDNKTHFDLKQNSNGSSIIRIEPDDAAYYINELHSYVSTVINSSQVPQANDLNKLFEIVEKRARGIFLTPEDLNLTPRQVSYYLHASFTLGFTKSYGSITALGLQLASSNFDDKMKITARAFQFSHCGWAWIQWSGVNDIRDLNSNSGGDFLVDKCSSSLSESTARRRGTTLKKWCDELAPFYTGI